MNLSVRDTLEWTIADGKIIVTPAKSDFLSYQNTIKIGKGSIDKDVKLAQVVPQELVDLLVINLPVLVDQQISEPSRLLQPPSDRLR